MKLVIMKRYDEIRNETAMLCSNSQKSYEAPTDHRMHVCVCMFGENVHTTRFYTCCVVID